MKRSEVQGSGFRVQGSEFGLPRCQARASTLKRRFLMKKPIMSGLMIVALGAGSVFAAQNANTAKKTKPAATTSGGGSATAGGTASGGTIKKPSAKKKHHPRHRRHSKKA